MKIDFEKCDGNLILKYEFDEDWITEKIKYGPIYFLQQALKFVQEDIVKKDDNNYYFKLGEIEENNYYRISANKISTNFDLFLDADLNIDWTWFASYVPYRTYKDKNGDNKETSRYGAILHAFKDFYKKDKLFIDKDDNYENEETGFHISASIYKQFVKKYPTATNIKYNKLSIFTNILREELDVEDYNLIYNKYKNKNSKSFNNDNEPFINPVKMNELTKYEYVNDVLKEILEQNRQGQYFHEDRFTEQIVEIFCLLNPKYIKVCKKINIDDFCAEARKNCQPDIALIDYDGNIDLIEVKSPNKYPNLFRKNKYREHYVPSGELNGCLNQLQQYLTSLTKMDNKLINLRNTDIANELNGTTLKAIHPKGYIIFGRSDISFSEPDKELKLKDFQIIKNMYSDVIDIVTFDDLIMRVQKIIDRFKNDK